MTNEAFSPALFAFLDELTAHNDRDWFNANKARYERDLREPSRALVRAMQPRLLELSPHIVADDRKTGGSLMRIYRDTRFSSDKTPYKTNVGIGFSNKAGKATPAPGFYLHIAVDELWAGLGMWQPPNPSLHKIRTAIDADHEGWTAIVNDPHFTAHWKRTGERLKRTPKDFAAAHPLADDLKLKSHIAGSQLTRDQLFSPTFPDLLAQLYQHAMPYMRFLSQAIGVEF